MRTLQVLALLFFTFCAAAPSWAGKCSGGAFCTACSNCSRCGHCSAGGTCSVCRPDLYKSASTSTSASDKSNYGSSGSGVDRAPVFREPQPYTSDDMARLQDEERREAENRRREAIQDAANKKLAVELDRKFRAEQQAKMNGGQGANSTLTGRCVAVTDGDTIKVLAGQKEFKIRLNGVDAPETGQPFGTQSKKFTSDAAFGKNVTVYSTGSDRYGRTLGWVFVGKTHVNAELVKSGMAWWYRQYAPDETKLRDLEAQARAQKIGLWRDRVRIAPWEWRRGARSTVTGAAPTAVPVATTSSTPEPESRSQSLIEGPLWWIVPAVFVAVATLISLMFQGKRP